MAADPIMLAEVPIFSLLDQDERKTLVEFLERRQVKAGELIFRTGDHADALYVVAEGKVEMFVNDDGGHKISIQEIGPTEVVGEVSFMDGGPRTASAIALEPTSLLRFERDSLLTFVTRHPHAALDLLTILGKRLRLSDELLRHTVVQNSNIVEEARMTFGERIADRVATFRRILDFIILFGVVMLVWIVATSVSPEAL